MTTQPVEGVELRLSHIVTEVPAVDIKVDDEVWWSTHGINVVAAEVGALGQSDYEPWWSTHGSGWWTVAEIDFDAAAANPVTHPETTHIVYLHRSTDTGAAAQKIWCGVGMRFLRKVTLL